MKLKLSNFKEKAFQYKDISLKKKLLPQSRFDDLCFDVPKNHARVF